MISESLYQETVVGMTAVFVLAGGIGSLKPLKSFVRYETPSLYKKSFLLVKKRREYIVYTEYVITFAP